MPCRKCKGQSVGPYCAQCVATFVAAIRNGGPTLRTQAIHFVQLGESNYLKRTVVYTDQVKEAQGGSAFGFRAESKDFTLLPNVSPSIAIEKFISPVGTTQTVCECKTFML